MFIYKSPIRSLSGALMLQLNRKPALHTKKKIPDPTNRSPMNLKSLVRRSTFHVDTMFDETSVN
ncbi:hypothetical protein RRG08_012263 [Elysia crispata]|uniref:Uncharacterized protein n=1 Tax=Elysia crispata TaxID=231223 RepID=A0AAE1BAL7_9GAST|nr:hypothetical protein RRG08_012263 [Elysia crispata]